MNDKRIFYIDFDVFQENRDRIFKFISENSRRIKEKRKSKCYIYFHLNGKLILIEKRKPDLINWYRRFRLIVNDGMVDNNDILHIRNTEMLFYALSYLENGVENEKNRNKENGFRIEKKNEKEKGNNENAG